MTTSYYPSQPLLKPAVSFSLALFVALAVAMGHLPFLAFAITLLAALIIQVADSSLGSWFLILTSLHAVWSYLSVAMPGSESSSANNASFFAPEAFKIYFIGIGAMLIGYGLSNKPRIHWGPVILQPKRFDRWTLALAALGSLLVAYVLNGIGFVQMMVTGTFSRYFGEEQVGSDYAFYQSLLRRGLAILIVVTPLLLLRWQQTKSKLLLLAGVTSLVFMLSTVRRGPILMALVALVLSYAVAGRHRRLIAILLISFVLAFFVLQALLVTIDADADTALASTAFILRSATSEVNDLAWVLSEWNHHWYMGDTWLAALWPLPATVSSFKNTYVLTSVTKDIVGISREFESGGLRISMFGEAYLNFGYIGVIGLGLLFGFLIRKFNGVVDWAKSQGPLILFPCMFFYLAGLYQFYLSGTGTLPDSILSFVVIAVVYGASRKKAVLPQVRL
jgi:oligosaccharide repeat unit polymerase